MDANHTDKSRWFTLARAAELLGSTPVNVLMHVKRGLLIGAEQEGDWLVDPQSLNELLRRRREEGPPAVCSSGCAKKTNTCGSCA